MSASMCFEDSYQESLQAHADRPFLAHYSLRGSITRKTFAEFDLDVRRQMHFLSEKLDGHSQIVTLAGNTYGHLVSIIAGWRLGIPVCPVNPGETPQRLEAKLSQLGGRSLVLDKPEVASGLSPAGHGKRQSPEHVSTLIFTSGSTGYSKIVEQREESLLANASDLIALHRLSPEVCVATSLPIFHVNALHFSVLTTLLSGARLVLFEQFSTVQVWDAIAREKVNILSAVPILLRHLLKDSAESQNYDLSSWRYAVSAAAALSPAIAREFQVTFKRKIMQGYGLSEAVNFSCLTPPDISDAEYDKMSLQAKIPSIGKALPGNEVVLFRDGIQVEAPGEEGELGIRGRNVMRGYRGEPTLKSEWLHTGDLGYFLLNDQGQKYFYISGRTKDIVKRGGLTISLREIDDVMAEFTKAESLAVNFTTDDLNEEIGLVVHAQEDVESELRDFLNAKLPTYLRPQIAILVDRPIRNSSGKASRWTYQHLFQAFTKEGVGRTLRVERSP